MKKFQRFLALAAAGCMMLSLAACGEGSGKGDAGRPLQIATKPITEQYILGHMLKQIIEDRTDYTCEVITGIAGGTNNIMPGMLSGEFDLYPEYTSSGYVLVLKHEDAVGVPDDEMWDVLQKEYNEQLNMSWVGLYGFDGTYGVTVRRETAEQYNLKTCSDLTEISDQLLFGANPDYIERLDGYPHLCDVYDYQFKNAMGVDIGLRYAALMNKEIDVTNGFLTDAQLVAQDVVVLEDDKQAQASYLASTVVRNEALESHPGLEDALMLMDGILTNEEMAHLNYLVEVEEQDETQVAHDYLVEKGILSE